MIAAAGELVRAAGASRQHAVGAVVIGEPCHPARAPPRRSRRRGIIVGDPSFGKLLFHRQSFDTPVATHHWERFPKRHGGGCKLECFRSRFEPHLSAISSTRPHDQAFRNQTLSLFILPIGLAEFLARQQLILERAHLGMEFKFAACIGAVGLREAPARTANRARLPSR